MSLCVLIDAAGYVKQSTSETIDTCTQYVLSTASEHNAMPTLIDVFTVPLVEDMQKMFMAGFGLPLIAYMTAWSFGVLIEMFVEHGKRK